MSVAIWVLPPGSGSVWTPVGEQGALRVDASTVHLEADEWGPSKGNFTVDLEPRVHDATFVPGAQCYIQIDGTRIWSGKVVDAARAGRRANVELAGRQMDLDDPQLAIDWLDNRFSVWGTGASDESNAVGSGPWDGSTTPGQTQASSDRIVLSWPQGNSDTSTNGFTNVEVLGLDYEARSNPGLIVPDIEPVKIAVKLHMNKSVTGMRFGMDSSDFIDSTPWGGWLNQPVATSGDYTFVASGTGAACLAFGLSTNSSLGINIPRGTSCRINSILVADNTAYIDSSGNSALLGSTAAARIAPLVGSLSADLSAIQATPSFLPAFVFDGTVSPRDALTQAKVYDDVLCKVDANDRLVFMPRPATPTLMIGADSPPTDETEIDPTNLIGAVDVVVAVANGPAQTTRYTASQLPEASSLSPIVLSSPRVGVLSFPYSVPTTQLQAAAFQFMRANNRLAFTQTRVVSDGHARDASSHLPLPAMSLLAYTSLPVRLADRIDPQTGAVGASGFVTGVAYDHGVRQATLSIGPRYGAADELVARIADIMQASGGTGGGGGKKVAGGITAAGGFTYKP